MLKVLIQRQFAELLRSVFFDVKKNKKRSKGSTILIIVLFLLFFVVFLGGAFTAMALGIGEAFLTNGLDWLYFAIMGGFALLMGVISGMFSAYTGLYQAKDNDLLMSLPVPTGAIIASRLLGVYLMDLLFSALVMIPTIVVSTIYTGFSVWRFAAGILFWLLISLLSLALSCLLGYGVALIASRLKNKSAISTVFSLLFIGAYYILYFRFQEKIREVTSNPELFGGQIRKSAPFLVGFGEAGTGAIPALPVLAAITLVILAVVIAVVVRSFAKIVSASQVTVRVKGSQKAAKARSVRGALLGKEFARFTSSSTYMLNCGLGTLMVFVVSGLLIWKRQEIIPVVRQIFGFAPGTEWIILAAVICMVAGINDMATPSVSLEGNRLWILQSLPVDARSVLMAKLQLQLSLTMVPALLCGLVCSLVLGAGPLDILLVLFFIAAYTLLSAAFGLTVGLIAPNLNWTNEVTPIKQSLSVLIVTFGSMLYAAALFGLYLLIGYSLGALGYLALAAFFSGGIAVLLLCWLRTRGAKRFEAL